MFERSSVVLFHCADQMAEWYKASASGSVDLGFDSESGQTNDFKIGIHSLPASRSAFKGQCGASRQVYSLCRWERHLTGFPHNGVVDRWLATPKRARTALRRFLVIGG